MTQFSYDSDLTGGSLLVPESRIVADLLLSGADKDEWHEQIVVQNRLQKRASATARRLAQSVRKRLERVEPEFWRALRDGDDDLATQAAFCAALARNLLLLQFMESTVADAYLTQSERLQPYQWDEFLQQCSQQDQKIDGWTESSRKKMGQVVFRILAEVGYLKNTRNLELQNVIVRPEIRVMLQDNYRHRLLQCIDISYRGAL